MAQVASELELSSPLKVDVLRALEPVVAELTEQHLASRKLWLPNELTKADRSNSEADEALLQQFRDAARGLPESVLVAVALNLLTEEGLPHFHRLIATHMGNESAWGQWNSIWTAEEDRHGCALRDYVRDARLFEMGALEKMQYQYIESGFNPKWDNDPYRLLAYTSLQEKATQIAHANTGRAAAAYEPQLQRVLAHLAGDESRHYRFYRAVFAEVLEHDPNQALESLLKVMPALAMPGHSIDGYDEMADVVRRADIYGPLHYRNIVKELLEFWGIAALEGLSAVGAAAQEKLMLIPARLERMANYLESRSKGQRRFEFGFLTAQSVTI